MRGRGGVLLAGGVLLGAAALAPGPALADHESTGTVVWADEGEVVLLGDGHYHVLSLAPGTVLQDGIGQPLRAVGIGDRVRERCRPSPGGGFTALRIEVLRRAWPQGAASEAL
ncbi:MAG TPA: hypothetical protein VIG69_14995 [Candidatus Methylomirabilis sp.]|jgi:hypothetical protein